MSLVWTCLSRKIVDVKVFWKIESGLYMQGKISSHLHSVVLLYFPKRMGPEKGREVRGMKHLDLWEGIIMITILILIILLTMLIIIIIKKALL